MSLERINNIIEKLKNRTYHWQPTRSREIPKQNGQIRRLGLPSWNDKLVQEVVRLILQAYYEPQFSEYSHGFRPGRGCHTALQEIKTWGGTRWFIEGDITGCFDNIDFKVLLVQACINSFRLYRCKKREIVEVEVTNERPTTQIPY